ncbi:predicted protein [Arabidopsis lyrata subsp. lyrata]|uniref:Predicted protein n=1 Tax=Arabidopsis lyrata subsp. lyrata TaxID=81972 RepID=D7LXA0_ARALL|nr:predicted protein [Arabidopsis lyrata subsp. lyrata]
MYWLTKLRIHVVTRDKATEYAIQLLPPIRPSSLNIREVKICSGIYHKKLGNPDDINALCRDVTDLMPKQRGEDAHVIPWDTCMKWVDNVCDHNACGSKSESLGVRHPNNFTNKTF